MGANVVRRQSGLGTTFSETTSEDNKMKSLILARIIKVYYKYQTVELEALSGKLSLGKGNNTEGRFSAPYPKSFTGLTPENEVYGSIPVMSPGMIVLVGFINDSPSNPIIINSYGLNEHNKQLVRTPLLSGDMRDDKNYKLNSASFTLSPSLTYQFKDGEGNEVNTWNGYTFQSITSDANNLPVATDYMDGSYYMDLYTSKYGDDSLIEPRIKQAPAMFFKHQGEYTSDGELDNHIYMDYIEPDGTHRTTSMNREEQWRTSVEQGHKGDWRVRYQADSIILDDALDYIEFGLDSDNQRFYIENPNHSFEVTDEGIIVDGKPLLANIDDSIEEAFKHLDEIESQMEEVQNILEGLGERSLRELINATNEAIAKTEQNETKISALNKAINENTNNITGMIEKYDNFMDTVRTYIQDNDTNINSIRDRLREVENSSDLEPLKKDLEKYKYKTYRDIRVEADLPRYFAGYDAILSGSQNTKYDLQAFAMDSKYYFLLFKPEGTGDKRNILVVYDKFLKEINKYFFGQGTIQTIAIDVPANTTNRYLYTKLDDQTIVSYDLTAIDSKDVLTFNDITSKEPRASYSVPVQDTILKVRDNWLVKTVIDSFGYATYTLYDKDFSNPSKLYKLRNNSDVVGSMMDGGNLAQVIQTQNTAGVQIVNSDNSIQDYTYSNTELNSFIQSKTGVSTSTAKQVGAFSSSDVYLSTIVYNEDTSYGKTKGIAIIEHKASNRDYKFREFSLPVDQRLTVACIGTKLFNTSTNSEINSIEDLLTTMTDLKMSSFSLYTNNTNIIDFNSSTKVPTDVIVTISMLTDKTFYVTYTFTKNNQENNYIIKNTSSGYSYVSIDNEPVLSNIDVYAIKNVGKSYVINGTNLPEGSTEGFVELRQTPNASLLVFIDATSLNQYGAIKKDTQWGDWKLLSKEIFKPKGGGSDKYKSMTELMSVVPAGTQWEIVTKNLYSDTLVTAIHGGGIEIGTSELAEEVATESNKDYFSFLGKKSSNNSELHVTSTNYDEPTLFTMLRRSLYSVAIHGASGDDKVIYVGGADTTNKAIMKSELINAGFEAQDAPDNLAGLEPNNISNQTKRKGCVQLELTTALRKSFFLNDDWSKANRSNRDNWTPTIFNLTTAITTAMSKFEND